MLNLADTFISFAAIMLGVSVLITILTQVITFFFHVRTKNLRWGLVRLFKNVDPKLKDDAETIADWVLIHPFVTQNHKPATVIRDDELIDILRKLAKDSTSGLSAKTRKAINAGIAVGKTESKSKLERWFIAVMDRATERYVRITLFITIILSFSITGLIHLDSIALLKKLSTDEAVRNNFIQISSAILEQDKNKVELSDSSMVFAEAIKQLSEKKSRSASFPTPPEFRYRTEAHKWLLANFTGDARAAEVIKNFDELVLEILTEQQTKLVSPRALAINDSLRSTGVQLIPQDYSKLKYGWREIVGMLMSVALLSLGGPFWYNSLSSLANLRPVLARKEERERQEAAP